MGDLECALADGDAVLVPAGSPHGFVGAGDKGFWGLSLQFESRGLYEDLRDPWASFEPMSFEGDPLERFLHQNDWLAERFSKHRIFTIAERGGFDDASAKSRVLDCLAVWSSYFQRVIQARAAFTTDPLIQRSANAHLADELGHDKSLGTRTQIWDPILDAIGSWFVLKAIESNDLEKAVVVHLVLERAAMIFYEKMDVLASTDASVHFEQHSGTDERHVDMGIQVLRQAGAAEIERLHALQEKAWDMLHSLLSRFTVLALQHD
jgi:hypothetical protein